MPVQSKYWIAVAIYLEYIWFMTFLIIMVITKSLWCHNIPPLNCRKNQYWKVLIPDNSPELYLSSVSLSKHISCNLKTKKKTLNIIRIIIINKFEKFSTEFFKQLSKCYFSISNRWTRRNPCIDIERELLSLFGDSPTIVNHYF